MHFVAWTVGVLAGITVWFAASYWIASSLAWVAEHYPRLNGSKGVRAGEVVACGGLLLACVAIAIFIARAILTQMD